MQNDLANKLINRITNRHQPINLQSIYVPEKADFSEINFGGSKNIHNNTMMQMAYELEQIVHERVGSHFSESLQVDEQRENDQSCQTNDLEPLEDLDIDLDSMMINPLLTVDISTKRLPHMEEEHAEMPQNLKIQEKFID